MQTINESTPIIAKVELIAGGVDGLKVTYRITEVRNKVASFVDVVKTQRRPTQKEIRSLFSELKPHLLYWTGHCFHDKKAYSIYKEITRMTSVKINEDQKFSLEGKMRLGDYITPIATPSVLRAEYDGYEQMKSTLDKLFDEVKLFMSGLKGADNRQVVIDYLTVEKGFADPDKAFDNMTDGEKDKFIAEAFSHFELEFVEEDGVKVLSIE